LPEYQQKQLAPVRIVEFSSKEQSLAYRSVDWEAGHYESNGNRDWIALGPDPNAANRAALLAHEYNHMVAARAGLRLPHWLSEGLAVLFSTVKPAGDTTRVGGPIGYRLATLKSGDWLSIEALTGADDRGFRGMTGREANLFYAESWLLTQLLYASPEYGPNFPKLITAVNEGTPTAEAFERAFGRGAAVVEKDLRGHAGEIAQLDREFPVRMDSASELAIETAAAGDFEIALVMADLLSVMRKENEAQRAFDALCPFGKPA
jgi:hypothetical protein